MRLQPRRWRERQGACEKTTKCAHGVTVLRLAYGINSRSRSDGPYLCCPPAAKALLPPIRPPQPAATYTFPFAPRLVSYTYLPGCQLSDVSQRRSAAGRVYLPSSFATLFSSWITRA